MTRDVAKSDAEISRLDCELGMLAEVRNETVPSDVRHTRRRWQCHWRMWGRMDVEPYPMNG